MPATFTVSALGDSSNAYDLRDCIDKANKTVGNDTIDFDNNAFKTSQTITLNSSLGSLEITEGVTIVASTLGKITISGDDSVRVFLIDSGCDSVTITNLTIIKGYTDGNGAAINSQADNLTLDHCTLTGNTADGKGGAVYSLYSALTIANSTVTTNSAGGAGGGICEVAGPYNDILEGDHNFSGLLVVDESVIESNNAGEGGGGIETEGYGPTHFIDSTITDNTATGDGGGILVSTGVLSLIDTCTISLNLSGGSGGGVMAPALLDGIVDSTISGNQASLTAGYGGGIYLGDSTNTMSIYNCSISTNSAANGGGVAVRGAFLSWTIEQCYIDSNVATYSGGGIYNRANLTLTYSTITLNVAGENGGGLAVLGGEVSIDGSSNAVFFTYNHADSGMGGGIFITEITDKFGPTSVEILSAGVTYGSAGFGGGIAIVGTYVPVTMDFSGGGGIGANTATYDGGGLYIENANVSANLGLSSSNTAGRNGGGLAVTGDSLTSMEVTITEANFNSALGPTQLATDGGGVAIYDTNAAVTFEDCEISDNFATGDGGGVYCNDVSEVTFTNCIIGTNGADHGGGAYITGTGSVTFYGCELDYNSASVDGAGIYVDDAPDFKIRNSTLAFNTADGNGGGVYESVAASTAATIVQCTIFGNEAVRGGGVYAEAAASSSSMTFYNSTIAANTATGTGAKGGGIFFTGFNTHQFTLRSTIVALNDAPTGVVDICGGTSTTEVLSAFNTWIGIDAGFTHDSSSFYVNIYYGDPGFKLDGASNLLSDQWGGPTKTVALSSISGCIDQGDNTLGLTTDQTGNTRVVNGKADIGAYEVQ